METPPRRLSKDEAYSLIEDYFSSGELPSVFYRRVGLSDNQFYSWRQRYLRDHPHIARQLGLSFSNGKTPRNASYHIEPNPALDTTIPTSSECSFARLDVSASSATPSSSAFAYELCYPNGVVLHLPADIATSSVMELIKLY